MIFAKGPYYSGYRDLKLCQGNIGLRDGRVQILAKGYCHVVLMAARGSATLPSPNLEQSDSDAQGIRNSNRSWEASHMGAGPGPRVSSDSMMVLAYHLLSDRLYSRLGLLNLGTIDIGGCIIFLLWRPIYSVPWRTMISKAIDCYLLVLFCFHRKLWQKWHLEGSGGEGAEALFISVGDSYLELGLLDRALGTDSAPHTDLAGSNSTGAKEL